MSEFADDIDRALGVRMRWGRNDCVLWAASVLRKRLGYDLAAEWRGKYYGRRSAYGILAKRGGLIRAVGKAIKRRGGVRCDGDVRPGDVVIINTTDGPAIALCHTPGWAVGRVDMGVAIVKLERNPPVAAWRLEGVCQR